MNRQNPIPTLQSEPPLQSDSLGAGFTGPATELQWCIGFPPVPPSLLPYGPPPDEEAEDQVEENWQALALGLQLMHPDWTVTQIAEEVGVCRATLYRSWWFATYRAAMHKLSLEDRVSRMPRGGLTGGDDEAGSDGHFEAWTPDKRVRRKGR